MSSKEKEMPFSYLLVGNWKMNPMSREEVDKYGKDFIEQTRSFDQVSCEVWISPPALYVQLFCDLSLEGVRVGAQDVSSEKNGSRTGDLSAQMMRKEGAVFSLVGHSERRMYHGEDNDVIHQKIRRILEEGMRVILCVGEHKEDREQGNVREKIRQQLLCLEGIEKEEGKNIILAYEPVWAVGSDRTPQTADIREVRDMIQEILQKLWDKDIAKKIKILYGGSVHEKNTWETCIASGMDGALVGRSSLNAKEFLAIARVFEKEKE